MQYDVDVELDLKVRASVSVDAIDLKEAYYLASLYAEEDSKDMLLYGNHEDTDITEVVVLNSYILGSMIDANEDAYDR